MSALGHSRRFAGLPEASGLSHEADMGTAGRHISEVPTSDTLIGKSKARITTGKKPRAAASGDYRQVEMFRLRDS